jgi:pimeloyl-ACP methyl ester carboxylesterase
MLMSAASTSLPIPEGPGSVSGAPHLPEGLTDTFTSRYVDIGALRLHIVIGGDGPPLLLVHGWPETWYAWRMLMPTLARDFQVIAVDQRGIGLSDKPEDGYDTGTLADDMVALMDALGHQRFAMYGTDTGMPIAYAVAADHRDRLDRLVVSEAPLPGVSPHAAAVPPPAAQRQVLAPRLQPAPRRGQRAARQGTGGHLLRRGVRRLGRDQQAPRRRRQVLHRHPPLRPRRPARQLRALPRVPHHHRAEPAAQGPAVDPARPGHRRRGKRR